MYRLNPNDDRYEDEVMDMQGNSDPEGTHRITIEDSDHPPSQICMPSPVFHSAASGLNNQLPSPPPTSDFTGEREPHPKRQGEPIMLLRTSANCC